MSSVSDIGSKMEESSTQLVTCQINLDNENNNQAPLSQHCNKIRLKHLTMRRYLVSKAISVIK